MTPAIGFRSCLASPREDSSEKGESKFGFSALCGVRACSVNGELVKSRDFFRNQDDLLRTFTDAFDEQVGPKDSKSAVVWLIWPFVASGAAFFTSLQSKRWAANRGFSLDLFVWCRCISCNQSLYPLEKSVLV